MDHLCFLCLMFFMLSRVFIAALSSPAGKGLTFWLLLVMFIVFLLLSHVVSWVRCGTCLYSVLIFAICLTLHYLYNFTFVPYVGDKINCPGQLIANPETYYTKQCDKENS